MVIRTIWRWMSSTKGYQLISWKKQGNRARSRIRSRMKHVFGVMPSRLKNLILRTIGIHAAKVKLGLCNIA